MSVIQVRDAAGDVSRTLTSHAAAEGRDAVTAPTSGRPRGVVLTVVVSLALVVAACGDASDPSGFTSPTPPAEPGTRVPDLQVTTFEGDDTSMAAHRGHPVVVNFWASWCPPCVAEMPDFQDVHTSVGDEVTFIGVNTQDSADAAAELVAETGVTYELWRDPEAELFHAFAVFGMPSTYFVDATGSIVASHTGVLTRDQLSAALAEHFDIDVPAPG